MPALSDDPLGIVAGYLEETDQRVMRQFDALMHRSVDPQIKVLTVNGRDACALWIRPNALRALRELRLTHCGNAELIDLAAVLKTLRKRPFALILDQKANTVVSARGLDALAEMTFSGITLRGANLAADAAQALARGASPVSISLPRQHFLLTQELFPFLQIRTLRSLDAGLRSLPDNFGPVVASHECLTHFSISIIGSEAFHDIAKSTTIESLSFEYIERDEVAALAALTGNSALRSLEIGFIRKPDTLAALSRNSSLRSVTLGLLRNAHFGFSHLANMPGLEALSLRRASTCTKLLNAEHVRALCTKTFTSLSLHEWDIEVAAQALIAATSTQHLSLNHPVPFSDAAISTISTNAAIASLSLGGGIITAAHAITLAGSPTLQQLKVGSGANFSVDAKTAIANAWRAAHKPLVNLQLRASVLNIER